MEVIVLIYAVFSCLSPHILSHGSRARVTGGKALNTAEKLSIHDKKQIYKDNKEPEVFIWSPNSPDTSLVDPGGICGNAGPPSSDPDWSGLFWEHEEGHYGQTSINQTLFVQHLSYHRIKTKAMKTIKRQDDLIRLNTNLHLAE